MCCFNTAIVKPNRRAIQQFFYGRKMLLKRVLDKYQDGNNHFESYYGINKTGKTWFFSAVQYRLLEAFRNKTGSIYPIYVNVGTIHPGQLLRHIFGTGIFTNTVCRDLAGQCEGVSAEDLQSSYINKIDASVDPLVLQSLIHDLLEMLSLYNIRFMFILDESQAFIGGVSDLTDLNYLTTLPISIALVGRISADAIYRAIGQGTGAMAVSVQRVPFGSNPFPGFDEEDLKEYWEIFSNKLNYVMHPSSRRIIENRAGTNPYLLALLGESIEAKIKHGNHHEITDDWLMHASETEFHHAFKRMIDILDAAHQLDDLARCTSYFDHRLIPELKKQELVNLGYLIKQKNGYRTISQDFTDYLMKSFIEKGREDRIIRLAECYLSRAIADYVIHSTRKTFSSLRNQDFSVALQFDLSGLKVNLNNPIFQEITLAPKLYAIKNNWGQQSLPSGGFCQYFNNDPYCKWKKHFENLREYRNKDAHVGVQYEVPESITSKGIASARLIALQLSKQFAAWEVT